MNYWCFGSDFSLVYLNIKIKINTYYLIIVKILTVTLGDIIEGKFF